MISRDKKGWSKGFYLGVWFPLATLFFLGGGLTSAHFFNGPFDWRYRTLSTLSSASSNPNGYAYCCVGLSVAFAMVLPLCRYFRVRLEPIAPRAARFASRALTTGFAGAIGVGVERLFSQSISLHTHKAHEYVALITFFGLLFGIAGFWLCLNLWLIRVRQWPVWALTVLFLFSAGPIIGTGLSQAYLYFVPNDLGWVGPHWADLGVPLYLSLAFWEWLTCVAIFVYLFLILFCLPAEIPVGTPRVASGAPLYRLNEGCPAD